jgi:hypothetical protein
MDASAKFKIPFAVRVSLVHAVPVTVSFEPAPSLPPTDTPAGIGRSILTSADTR